MTILSLLKVVLFFALLIALVACLARFGLSPLYDVRVSGEGIDIILFRRVVAGTIKYRSIRAVYRRGFLMSDQDTWSSYLCTVPLTNRISMMPVIIRLERRCFGAVAVTPASPNEFVDQVRQRIANG